MTIISKKKYKVKDDERIIAVIEKNKILTHDAPENPDMSYQDLIKCRDELRKLIELLENSLKESKSTLPQ